MSKPIVAIVGRPNVGKSTLFNALAGETISIVKDTPGVTRDRIYADATWLNYSFTLIDTGGIEPESKDVILAQMRDQAQIAIDTADVIIFITDVRQGLVDADSKVADMLRRSGKPVLLVVNKVDSFAKFMPDVYEFYNLGIGDPIPISASSKLGMGDMLDEVVKYFPTEEEEEEENEIPQMRILKLLIQIVLWSFSFFATPICMAHLTALLEKRCVQMPEVVLPEPVPLSRSAKPFRRSTAVLTACCFTVAALGLNLSYVYSVFTGKANFRLALFQNPTVMAHRGLSADAPENTLYAFSDAISVGADFIELDVQQTRDGVLVVMHDSNLKRTTGVNKDIWDVDYADIQNLDAGSWFDPAYANARIPTLEETLQFVDKRAKLNIEIKPTKHGSDTLEQDVAELITQYQYTDACYVTSFSYGSLKKVKEVNPEIRTGYLMSVAYGQFYSLKYADAFSLNKVFVTSQVVNAAHQQGKQIFAWTVNSMSEVRSLCNLHVDSIITDDPVMVQNVISRDSTGETLRSVLDYFIN